MTEQPHDDTTDARGGLAMLAALGLTVGNFVVLMLASGAVLGAFPSLAAEVFGRNFVAFVLVFIILMNCSPEGRSGWIRLVLGILVIDGAALLLCALAALLAPAVPAGGAHEIGGGFLEWGQIVVLFMMFFPLSSGLARIGLLPGFRWGRDAAPAERGTKEEEPAEAAPTWLPPRFVHVFPGMVVLFGLMTAGPDAFGRLAAAWPDSILPAMDPRETVLLIATGGMAGIAARFRCRWPASLAAVLLCAVAMGLITVGFALSLPAWAWLGLGPRASQSIVEITPLLFPTAIIGYFVNREIRRSEGATAAGPGEPAPGEPRV